MSVDGQEFVFQIKALTEDGLLIEDDIEPFWLPKSQLECLDRDMEDLEAGDEAEFWVPDWLAEKNNIW